jgi:hypothetical protein
MWYLFIFAYCNWNHWDKPEVDVSHSVSSASILYFPNRISESKIERGVYENAHSFRPFECGMHRTLYLLTPTLL